MVAVAKNRHQSSQDEAVSESRKNRWRDNTTKMRKISILKVEPINFTLKNNPEKEVIIRTFQKFLNSLDFPIQIVIATDTLNLDTYLSKLEERSDKLEQKDY